MNHISYSTVRAALAMLLLFTPYAWSVAPVEVVGLFKDRAVVRLAEGEVMLKVGETKQGVTLLSADASKATVRYRGERYDLGLSNRVVGGYQRVEQAQVAITSDRRGQYQVRGAINGGFTTFLVDTGASVIAVSSELATSLNVDYSAGEQGVVETAQGRTRAHFVTLNEVTVGSISAYNVQAAVIDGSFPQVPLLGMSFLSQVSINEADGVLTLTKRN